MKIITVVGARPQFIKAAAVSRCILELNKTNSFIINEKIIHTGQHYDANLSDIFFEEMEIPKPEYTLGIGGSTHGAMTGRQLEKIEEILIAESPDYLMVYGDTNSTLAGALAAVKLKIPVVHIEAGLRSFNMNMPEEINRILTDNVSKILLCPTKEAMLNLEEEGFLKKDVHIHNVGDVMLDAALYYKNQAKPPEKIKDIKDDYILCTCHRAENTDNVEIMTSIVNSINKISEFKKVVLPLHPRTTKTIEKYNLKFNDNNVILLEPVGYFEMLWLIENCSLVVTDSGGLQKEAYFFKKPCVTMRNETEWVELVHAGANTLVNTLENNLTEVVQKAIKTSKNVFKDELYGNGMAAEKILDIICNNKKLET